MKTHVLLIDDCPNISVMLKVIVERFFSNDVRLTTARTLDAGLNVVEVDAPDVILLDYSLEPGSDCEVSISHIRSAPFDGPIHLWSNHDRGIVTRHPSVRHVTSFFQKQDYIGMRLRTLVEEHFCQPMRIEDCESHDPRSQVCNACVSA